MKRFLLLFGLLSLVVFSANCSTCKFKLLSFNIRYAGAKEDTGALEWDNRKAAMVAMIGVEKPDVIGLQEVKQVQIDFLVKSLPQYEYSECGRDAGVRPAGGEHIMVMWLKDKYELLDTGHYWLSDTPQCVSRGWDGMCRRITVWARLKDRATGHEFFYFNTHLDHKGAEARIRGAELNVSEMKRIAGDHATVLISGDMNAERGKESGACLAEYDAWMLSARETARRSDGEATFNGFGKANRMWLDHIFFRGARAVRYRTLVGNYGVEYLSDHYPTVCEFKF